MREETTEKAVVRPMPVPDGLDEYMHGHLRSSAYPRTSEKAKLMDAHKAGANPLIICGQHGSGKTFLARELARDLTKDIEFEQNPSKTYLLTFDSSVRKTIINHHIPLYVLFPEVGWSASDVEIEQQRYKDKLSLLRQVPDNSVFILDGVDTMPLTEVFKEPEFTDLLSLGTVIVTSADTSCFPEWIIEPVPDECRTHPPRTPVSYTETEKIILQSASLLPPTGLNMPPFALAHGKESQDTVIKLILEGSLFMSAHRKILPTDLVYSGTDDDYIPFLMYLHHLSKNPKTSLMDYEEICQVFKKAAYFLEDKDGQFARMAGQLFRARGAQLEAIPLFERFLAKQRQLESQNTITLAQALYEVGCIRGFQALNHKGGNRDELIEGCTAMLLQALELQKDNQDCGKVDLVKTMLTLAQMGADIPGYQDQAVLEIFVLSQLSDLPEDHVAIAEILLEVANLHPGPFAERRIRKAYVERAISIVSKWNSCDATQADTYNMMAEECSIIADAYSMMADCLTYAELDERIALMGHALEIREKYCPHERHTIYLEHHHRAWLYNRHHDYQHEVEELEAAIGILIEMLPPNHPRILGHWKELEAAIIRAESEEN